MLHILFLFSIALINSTVVAGGKNETVEKNAAALAAWEAQRRASSSLPRIGTFKGAYLPGIDALSNKARRRQGLGRRSSSSSQATSPVTPTSAQ